MYFSESILLNILSLLHKQSEDEDILSYFLLIQCVEIIRNICRMWYMRFELVNRSLFIYFIYLIASFYNILRYEKKTKKNSKKMSSLPLLLSVDDEIDITFFSLFFLASSPSVFIRRLSTSYHLLIRVQL